MKSIKQGADHEAQLKQLKRIEGQIRGISSMVEEKRYCIDILTQLKAVKASLSAVEQKIINGHINHCVHKAVESKNSKMANEMLEEIKDLLKASR